MTELQKRVVSEAKIRLQREYGLKQVCLDLLPSTDVEIDEKGFERTVDALVLDTCSWDL